MSTKLYNKIYEFLTTAEDKKINAISVNELRTVINRAVDSASNRYIEGSERQLRIFRILPQFDSAFEGVYGLYNMGAIKTDKEQLLTSDQIRKNISEVKRKLGKDTLLLYQHLYSGVNKISVQELTWKDSLANQIIRDRNLKKAFIVYMCLGVNQLPADTNSKPIRSMKPVPIPRIEDMCRRFVSNFLSENLSSLPYKLSHTKKWKESEDKLEEITLKILETFERQSVASADRKGDGRVGRWPDIMFISKEDDKFYKLMYAECSRIICTKQKEEDDDIKLWCECNDGLYWAQKSRRLEKEQFGIIGIQVAGCRLSLNVLIRDELEIHRYYKLHEAEIPIRYSNDPSILADFIYTYYYSAIH
ncbi:hypothetical protein Glove_199g104 [Diversispora epigaea]|uniref:Uncharacterized protein n=1 Tax=Diversispora epigaea TaxID=1348612 RepID=A0A397IN72_9GLOM|nr:hypothetical protein Glove_199g104 [Diversispora epigaea]